MKLTQRTLSKLLQSAGSGGQRILAFLLCLSLLIPSAAVFASVPEGGMASSSAVPVIDTNIDLNLPVGTTAQIDASLLHASEVGVIPQDLVFTLVMNVTQGMLKVEGTPLSKGSTFTQQDIDAGFLTYTALDTVSTDGFTFHVTDRAGGVSANLVYTIHINRPEPTVYPDNFQAVADSTSQITTTWTDVSGDAAPDGYLVLCAPGWIQTISPDTTTPIDNTCMDGSGSMHVPPGVGKVTWQGLYSETNYSFAIFPYTRTEYAQTPGAYYDYLTSATPPQTSARTGLTYSISGMVTDSTLGFGLMGVRIDAGNGLTAYSGEDGTYTLTGLTPGDYTLTASLSYYTLTPDTLSVTVSDENNHVGGMDFSGTAWPSIRGTVTEGTNSLMGVAISDGLGQTATTQEDGSYTFHVPDNWSGTLVPQLMNYYFLPDQTSYTNVTSDQTNQNYLGVKLSVSWDRFTAAWDSLSWAKGYYLDVATDPEFTNFVPGYQNKDVGNVTQVEVEGLSPLTHYFYRVRAYDLTMTGEDSHPIEVITTRMKVFLPIVTVRH